MSQKSPHRRIPKKRPPFPTKIPGSGLQTLLIPLFIGITVFSAGKYFIKVPIPCANSKSCQSDLIQKVENGTVGIFQGHQVAAPVINLAEETKRQNVLGTQIPNPNKHIYVDLSTQTIYAYDGEMKFIETFVSSGRWGRTPVGNFHIWQKLVSTRMSGGSGDDAYDLPNVPYVMYFYRDFGLHGAYWHNNFGYTMSHGCINLRPVDAKTLFEWAHGPSDGQPGTLVSICNQFEEPDNCIQENPINT